MKKVFNKITCSGCGTIKGTTPMRYKEFEAAGTLDKYLCRACKAKAEGKVSVSKITCSVCNRKFGSNPTRTKKLIAQYGTMELVLKSYVCRDCRKNNKIAHIAPAAVEAPKPRFTINIVRFSHDDTDKELRWSAVDRELSKIMGDNSDKK